MKSKGFQILGPGSKEGGQEPAGSEGAKFRLWVKSKGLTLYPGDENDASSFLENQKRRRTLCIFQLVHN